MSPEAGFIIETMHYMAKSQNGLGIAKNGALGCKYHHTLMDNGNKGLRAEMRDIFKDYLKSHYPDWDEKDLVYTKWRF